MPNAPKIFPNVFRACKATNWSELLNTPILPREIHLSEVAKSFAYFCDDRRIVEAKGKTHSNKKISVYTCQCCSWEVKFVKRNGAVAKDDPWYLDSWGTHDDGCGPVKVLKQGDILRNSLELREYLSVHEDAKKDAILAFLLTINIDASKMGNGSFYKAKDNILSLLRMLHDDEESAPSFGSSFHFSLVSAPSASTPVSDALRRMAVDLPDSVASAGGTEESSSPGECLRESARGLLLLNNPATTRVEAASYSNEPSVGTFSASNEFTDMSQNTPDILSVISNQADHDIIMNDILSANYNQGSQGNHQARTSAEVPQYAGENGEAVNATPAHNFNPNHDIATINTDLDTITAGVGTVSLSNASSIETFMVSNGSMNISAGSTRTKNKQNLEANGKHSCSSNTSRSTGPPVQKVRSSSFSNPPSKTSFAPDSLFSFVFDGMPLVDDAIVFNDGVQARNSASNELEEYARLDSNHHESRDTKMRAIPRTKPTPSVTLTNFEIAIEHGDKSTATAGLENVAGVSAEWMLSELSKPSLSVKDTKWMLGELSERAINDDSQLRGRDVADQAAGVVSIVVDRHLDNVGILYEALIFASHLNQNDSLQVSDEFVAQAMLVLELHHAHASLFYRVLVLLQDLQHRTDNGGKIIATPPGIKSILNGMHRHSNRADIQEEGCQLLGYLARKNREHKGTIAISNGIALILQAMQRHEQDENVQQAGFWALNCLVKGSEVNQRAMVEADGVEIIQHAIGNFPESHMVKEYGGTLLQFCTMDAEWLEYWGISLAVRTRDSSSL